MLVGKRHRVREVEVGLGTDGRPIFEGHVISKGKPPFKERIKRRYDRVCALCGADAYHGRFRVAMTEYGVGVPVYRTVDFVSFECLSCLHESDPVMYPYTGIKDAYGGD